MFASALAAAAVLIGWVPVTVSEISGLVRVAPAADAPTCATETCPRIADGLRSARDAACS